MMDYAMITYITYIINQVVSSRPSPGLSGLTETQVSLIFPMFDTVRAWGPKAAKGCQGGESENIFGARSPLEMPMWRAYQETT